MALTNRSGLQQGNNDILVKEAAQLRDAARRAASGTERDLLLKRARQAETAARADDWMASLGLRPPN